MLIWCRYIYCYHIHIVMDRYSFSHLDSLQSVYIESEPSSTSDCGRLPTRLGINYHNELNMRADHFSRGETIVRTPTPLCFVHSLSGIRECGCWETESGYVGYYLHKDIYTTTKVHRFSLLFSADHDPHPHSAWPPVWSSPKCIVLPFALFYNII